MFKTSSEVLSFIKDTDVKFLDIRFTDLPGVQQHFNIPASTVDEDFFTVGQLFDGSSIRGFQSIHESDLQLIPDVTTAYVDPFRAERTLVMLFDIYNPRNGEIYGRDPRQVAKKAEKFLASTGIADTAFFAPGLLPVRDTRGSRAVADLADLIHKSLRQNPDAPMTRLEISEMYDNKPEFQSKRMRFAIGLLLEQGMVIQRRRRGIASGPMELVLAEGYIRMNAT